MDEEYRELERQYQATGDPELLEKIYQFRKRVAPDKTMGFLEPWEPEWTKAWECCPSDLDPETGENWQYMGSHLQPTPWGGGSSYRWHHEFRHRQGSGYHTSRAKITKTAPASPNWYPKPRRNPEEENPIIKETMEAYGFIRHPGKPGHWVEPYSGLSIRHRNLLRWAKESPDLKKRITDEVGRLLGLRDNPESLDERLKSKLRAYSISREAEDAVSFAEEFLRSHKLESNPDLELMNIAQYCVSRQNWWTIEDRDPRYRGLQTRNRVWDWLVEHANFRHRNGEELIMYIRDPATPYSLGLTEEAKHLLFPNIPKEIAPIVDQAIKLGYEYLCFYA